MNVTLNKKLMKHMKANNLKDIIIYTTMSNTWCGSFLNISARFADQDEQLQDAEYHKIETEIGNVFLQKKGMYYAHEVRLGFRKLLWMPGITVAGVELA